MPAITKEIINAAIEGFEAQKHHIDAQIAELRAMLAPVATAATSTGTMGRTKRGMSAAGRKAIAEAQRKRWAAARGESAAPATAKKPKRKLSAAGRAAIVAALKKRWAAKKAASSGKTEAVAKKGPRKKGA